MTDNITRNYRTTLENLGSGRGRLSIHYSSNGNGADNSDVSLEHSLRVLEDVQAGEFCVGSYGRSKKRNEIIKEYSSSLNGGVVNRLAYVLLLEHPFFFQVNGDDKDKIISHSELDRIARSSLTAEGKERRSEMLEERVLFTSLNHYKKNLHNSARKILSDGDDGMDVVSDMVTSYDAVNAFVNWIYRFNVGLIYYISERERRIDDDDAKDVLNLSLLRVINCFDLTRGHRFSSFACDVMLKDIRKFYRKESKYFGRLSFIEDFFGPDTKLDEEDEEEMLGAEIVSGIIHDESNPADLTDTERMIIQCRFPFDGIQSQTLEQIGETIGVSKERIRQMQNMGLKKIRAIFNTRYDNLVRG
ncbi:sigma-70 family RNA polymerase sigma factor [Candidatus Pacearchaeota archaeon]|nr:sigma-70 family RNA polymerase sigma factor [Candidatus Pacearchaeota archaeon]